MPDWYKTALANGLIDPNDQAAKDQRPNKYRNVPQVVDGIRFASKAEAERYGELKLMRQQGLIADLECHPKFPLLVAGTKCGNYQADFRYVDLATGRTIVEDVKGGKSTTAYRLKKRLVRALYGVQVVEVRKGK